MYIELLDVLARLGFAGSEHSSFSFDSCSTACVDLCRTNEEHPAGEVAWEVGWEVASSCRPYGRVALTVAVASASGCCCGRKAVAVVPAVEAVRCSWILGRKRRDKEHDEPFPSPSALPCSFLLWEVLQSPKD